MEILNTIQDYITRHQLLHRDAPVVVGLSGGADSVALLDILSLLGYSCIAAHCNFHLRGNESQRDESFVATFASKKNIPYVKTDFDTGNYAAKKHISIEMAARELRYAWFEKMRIRYDAQAIAVAHHQDDSVETVLLNLIRGTGIRGLSGMDPKNGNIVRPLLAVSRENILTYINNRRLEYVTDSTNLSDIYIRNFIRLNLIPMMEKLNPSVKTSIFRSAGHLKDAETIFLYAVDNARKQIMQKDKISIRLLKSFPAPKTILYEILKPYGFTSQTTEDVFRSIDKTPGKTFYSPTYTLIKDREFLLLQPNKTREDLVYYIDSENQTMEYPIRLTFQQELITESFQIDKNRNIAYFDLEKLTFPLILRHWNEGDWFIPFGMKGRKKLSDYFSDRKFSLADKRNCWILCSGKEILWIVGERTDNRFRIDNSTEKAYVIKFSIENGVS